MKIDLCRLFGVEEGEEFKVDAYVNWFSNFKYKIRDNTLLHSKLRENDFTVCSLSLNELKYIKEITKLPKKKQFSQDTLNFFKCIDKEWEWIAKDFDGEIFIYDKKPNKDRDSWNGKGVTGVYINNYVNQSLFDQILWEDEEPICIDDYVER